MHNPFVVTFVFLSRCTTSYIKTRSKPQKKMVHLSGQIEMLLDSRRIHCHSRYLQLCTDHGECFRSVEGRTGIDEDTIREFFHTFMDWMVQRFYAEFITVPYDEQLAFVVSDYEKIGFPGAVGSVDCVHIPWDRCPYEYRQMNRSGKDGFPTRVYEVTYLIP
jgi:hypothetical protein